MDTSRDYTIAPATEVDESLKAAVKRLMPQLKPDFKNKDPQYLKEIINGAHSVLLIARDENDILGILVINLVYKPVKVEARIDDVVVDEATRGRGIGRGLMEAAVAWAWEHGADKIEFTSRPEREAANTLYQRMGFELRETNVYQMKRNK